MKLARFSINGTNGLGVVSDGVISIARHLPDAPTEMCEFIANWDRLLPELTDLAQRHADHALADVKLLAPVPSPRKIFGIGLNYADHVEESGMGAPAEQMWFSKPPTAANGPYDPISLPRVSEQLDYEAELVVVIGKSCRYADTATAADAIFGYCAGNDVSVRDWQFRTSQFMLGKSFDSHAPHGPWIVTKNVIDANNLEIQCFVNGDERQHSNTRHLIFNPVAQVEYLSQVMTLEPGDLLFTGTPGGVGAAMKPPVWLKRGDRVRVAISGIGEIENEVLAD